MLGLLTSLAWAGPAAPVLAIEQGSIQGVIRDGMQVFYNLPFAKPPIGELRWRVPQPADSWEGIRSAQEMGAACAQEQSPGWDRFPKGTSEDCLYLNVFVPEKRSATPLPVMVWMHGGSFRWGSAMDPAFDGQALTREGVILVTINYRLDRFGRFAHPALSVLQAGEPLGNYALMDQVAALKWVQKNILSFGGDPSNVTIFGCSAGGVSVDFLMASRKSMGLFSRAIAQSGSIVPEGERRLAKAVGMFPTLEEDGLKFATYFGLSDAVVNGDLQGDESTRHASTVVEKLRGLTAEQVLSYPQKDFSMQPIVDGDLIADDPARIFARGEQMRVPLMSGAATYEASLIRPYNLPLNLILGKVGMSAAQKAYGIDEPTQLKDVFFGDSLFLSTAYFLTAQMTRAGQPSYLYEYAYINEDQRGMNPGAYHCSETSRVFGTAWRGEQAQAQDIRMGEVLRGYWTRFAKTGNPNSDTAPDFWPANRFDQPYLLRLDTASQPVANPYPERMQLHLQRHPE